MRYTRINKAPLLLYFFFLLIVLFSQQKTPTGQAVLLFDNGFTDNAEDVQEGILIQEESSAPLIEQGEQSNEGIVAGIVDAEKIEIVDASIQSGKQEITEKVKVEEEVVVENIQQVSDGLVEEIEAPLENVEDQTALSSEELHPVQEAMTIEEFMVTLSSQTVVIIGENAPIEHLISALQLASTFGLHLVKESTVEDLFALHAISLGSGYVNAVSAFALDQGAIASDEGNYFIYENKETGSVILVVAGVTPKETRKAVHDLLKY